MDIPFTIHLKIEQINFINEADILKITEYPINVTLDHTIADVKNLIWRNSQDYSLKPVFIKLKYDGRPLNDHEKMCDVLQTPEAPSLLVSQDFVLVIDYTLFNSPSIPRRDPVEELFDIMVDFEEANGENKRIKLRESLECTIGVLKEYVAEERAKRVKRAKDSSKDSFTLILTSTKESCLDDEVRLSEVLKLDVTPLGPVLFKGRINDIPDDPSPSVNRRFHIRIISTISELEDGNNLFELNFKTKVQDFKQQIIERIDYQSVRRTFFDQIKLYYATQLIENTFEMNCKTVSDVLLLNDDVLNQSNGIISMNLEISNNLSGNGGVLSREFLRDLRADNRFEFLPTRETTTRDISPAEQENTISPIESTKIILEGEEEWNLVGETFEVIQHQGNSNSNNRGKLLINQSNISSFDYEFSVKVPGEDAERKVLLNTSQCIVVDNGSHQPYVLLSPAGAARLNTVIRLADNQPLIQKVNILMYEDTHDIASNGSQQANFNVRNDQNAPNPVRNQGETIANIAIDLVRNNIRRWLSVITRSLFLIYILGINTLFVAFWKEILAYGLIFGSLYLLFFSGNEVANWIEAKFHLNDHDNRPRGLDERLLLKVTRLLHFTDTITTDIFSVLKNELVHTAIDRTRQYEYVFRREFDQESIWFYIVDTFTNMGKDILLMVLSLFPSFYSKIYEELEAYRSNENEDLALQVRMLREMTIDAVHRQRQGSNTSKFTEDLIRHYTGHSFDELTQESSESETYSASEDRYQALIEYYIRLHNVRTDLKKSIIDYETAISADGST